MLLSDEEDGPPPVTVLLLDINSDDDDPAADVNDVDDVVADVALDRCCTSSPSSLTIACLDALSVTVITNGDRRSLEGRWSDVGTER